MALLYISPILIILCQRSKQLPRPFVIMVVNLPLPYAGIIYMVCNFTLKKARKSA